VSRSAASDARSRDFSHPFHCADRKIRERLGSLTVLFDRRLRLEVGGVGFCAHRNMGVEAERSSVFAPQKQRVPAGWTP
jgi:hypothetical protein